MFQVLLAAIEMFVLEFALMALGFELTASIKDHWAFTFAAGLDQIKSGMLLPTLLTWALSNLPFELRGRGAGIWTATFALGQFVCDNAAIPMITAHRGSILSTIGVLGWACAAAALVALAMKFVAPRPSHG